MQGCPQRKYECDWDHAQSCRSKRQKLFCYTKELNHLYLKLEISCAVLCSNTLFNPSKELSFLIFLCCFTKKRATCASFWNALTIWPPNLALCLSEGCKRHTQFLFFTEASERRLWAFHFGEDVQEGLIFWCFYSFFVVEVTNLHYNKTVNSGLTHFEDKLL